MGTGIKPFTNIHKLSINNQIFFWFSSFRFIDSLTKCDRIQYNNLIFQYAIDIIKSIGKYKLLQSVAKNKAKFLFLRNGVAGRHFSFVNNIVSSIRNRLKTFSMSTKVSKEQIKLSSFISSVGSILLDETTLSIQFDEVKNINRHSMSTSLIQLKKKSYLKKKEKEEEV